MAYKEFGATIAPSNVSSTGFPIAMGTHIGGGRIVNDKSTLNSKHWCLLGEGATLNDQKANAIGQIWYDTSDNKYWKLDSWASTNPVWVDVSTIFATRSYVDDAINNIPDPMIFKGSLGTGGTITSLPTASTSNTGFTYKVITAGTYAGQVAKVGDTFISDGTIWNLIPSGDDAGGTVTNIATGTGLSGGPITTTGTINLATAYGDSINPYGSKTAKYVLAAPNATNGTPSFRALVESDIPLSLSSITTALGYTPYNNTNPNGYTSNIGTVTSITLNATSPILIDDSNAITTSGTRTFSHASTSGNKHIPSGGSANQILRWTADGTAVWSNEVNTHYTSKNIVSSSATGITNTNTTNPYLNHIEESTITSSHRINGSGATTVSSDVGGNITISSTDTNTTYSFATGTTNGTFNVTPSGGSATAISIYGLGSAAYTSSTSYASSSHNHSVFTTTENGFVPKSVTSNTTDFLRRDGTWATPTTTYSLPLASNGTRGGIQIGYTATGANLPLLLSSEKGYITLTSSSITTGLGYTPYNSTNPNNYTSNTGTVTNIATGTGLTGGSITTTGTIGLAAGYGDSVNPYTSKTAGWVLAAPVNINGVPSFRALVASDIPVLNQNTTGSAGSVLNYIKFDDDGVGADPGTTYDGSAGFTISYNTIGAAPSNHTHSTYVNQTLTSGDGMDAWTATNGDLTIALGTPSTITGSSTNSVSSTSHTHAISITPANIGAAPSSHTHDYSLLTNLPEIYNANHDGVPDTDFDILYTKQNNIWLCESSMRNGPLDNSGNTNSSYNTFFDNCVIQQFGDGTKIQVLYITTGSVTGLNRDSIFYRMQGNKWKRIVTYSEIEHLQTKMTEASGSPFTISGTSSSVRELIVPEPNVVKAYKNSSGTQFYKINDYINSLEEAIIIINDDSNLNTKFNITVNSSYKISGPFTPAVDFTGPMILTIWRGTILSTLRS